MVNMMSLTCIECGSELVIPEDAEQGEIIECPDCGIDYAIEVDDKGRLFLQVLNLEGEDWGE